MTSTGRAGRLICAIDTADLETACSLSTALAGSVGAVKLGLEFFAAHGPDGVRSVTERGLPVFLDLKLHDIPNTVAGAVRMALRSAPLMVTVHASGGPAMMRAAAAAALRVAEGAELGERPKLLAVTVLTSFDDSDLAAVGMHGPLDDQVRRLAALAQECGMDGVVASAHEVAALRRQCGADFTLVVPGIRPGWASADDQKRIVTPSEAVRLGADYLVVGRPITRAEAPAAAAARIADELAQVAA